jgi:outer membrane protein insertion porin family
MFDVRRARSILGVPSLFALLAAAFGAVSAERGAESSLLEAASAQPPLQARDAKAPVKSIKVVGSKKFAEEQIAAASGLKIGDVVGKDEIQAAADRLAQLGPFQNVRYKFSGTSDSVEIEVSLEDAPTVPVMFDNFPLFGDDELIQTLKDAVVLFDGTAPQQGTILEQMTETLRQLLEKRGIKATVELTLLAGPGETGMIQRFQMAGITGLKIGAVRFGDGVATESRKLVVPLMDMVGKPFSRFAVAVFADEQVRPLYLEKGFLRVQFGAPQAQFTGNPNQPLPDTVTAFLPITPGPEFHWAGATWSGNTVFVESALRDFVGLAPGEVANGMKIEAAWERVRSEYGQQGYLDAALEPQATFDDAAQKVSYLVKITEGPRYRMGQLVITGLSLTAERLLAAAWRIPAGQVFDKTYYEEFLENQARKKMAFGEHIVNFKEVGHLLRTDPAKKTVDVLLDFH